MGKTGEVVPEPPESALVERLAKKRLLGAKHAFVICADESKSKCASGKRMKRAWKALKRGIKRRGAVGRAALAVRSECLGVCCDGPLIGVFPPGRWYGQCDEAKVERILDEHLGEETKPTAEDQPR